MATKKQIKVTRFDNSAFAGILAFIPFENDGYTTIGETQFANSLEIASSTGAFQDAELNDLAEAANSLVDFSLLAFPETLKPDLENLLSVKVEGGAATPYAPCLMRGEDDQLILQVGSNRIDVQQDGEDLSVGKLSGTVLTASLDSTDGGKWCKITIKFKDPDGNQYYVGAVNDPDSNPSEQEVSTSVASGEPLAKFLRKIGTGGKFAKLKDLPLGHHTLAGVLHRPDSPYCKIEMILADGRTVTPNKQLLTILEGFLKVFKGDYTRLSEFYRGQDLVIISQEDKGTKTFVKARFDNSSNIQGGVKPPALTPQVQQALPEAQTVDVPSVVSDADVERVLEDYPM